MTNITHNLCMCGECKDAVERAVGTIIKQIGDGECPIFIAAVAFAQSALAEAVLKNFVERHDPGIENQVSTGIQTHIFHEMLRTKSQHTRAINDAFERHAKARKQD